MSKTPKRKTFTEEIKGKNEGNVFSKNWCFQICNTAQKRNIRILVKNNAWDRAEKIEKTGEFLSKKNKRNIFTEEIKGKMKETFSLKTGVFKSVILGKNETLGFWSQIMPETGQRILKKNKKKLLVKKNLP